MTATVSKQYDPDCYPSFGNGANCCKEYNDGMKSFRTGVLLIFKNPYCIGTILALILNLILPDEEEGEEEKSVTEARTATIETNEA